MKDNRLLNSLLFAFKRTIPIMIGFFPVGLVYGILMSKAGYNIWWTGLCSLTVFAGSLITFDTAGIDFAIS